MRALVDWWRGPEISLIHEFHAPPWGGGNQFLLALRGELERRGFRVGANRVGSATRACLFNSFNFDSRRLRALRRFAVRAVHRVDGPIGTYRGTDHALDRRIWTLNRSFADATVFQSRYSLEAHEALGLQFRAPRVITNSVDPRFFHAAGRRLWDPGRRVRVVSTSWSDNPNKGFETYRWLEERLDWIRFEYTFVGRTPVPFQRARVLPPVGSEELGRHLREHDVYVTASRHEACSNGLLEALACGLPALYIRSGSNGELVGEAGLGFDSRDELLEQLDVLVREYRQRQAAISVPSLTDVADRYLDLMAIPAGGLAADGRL